MNIILLGANGQLGRALHSALKNVGHITALDRNQLDMQQPTDIAHKLSALHADIIINAAAYTAVDQAEHDKNTAFVVNALAVEALANFALTHNALLIHFSTDYVFDGTQNRPYVEADQPASLNTYGKSKLAGENAIQRSGCNHVILRTSWLYGPVGHNFVRRIVELAQTRPELHVVNDQFGSPTSTLQLATATRRLIEQLSLKGVMRSIRELYHLSGAGSTNWFEFAQEILVQSARAGVLENTPPLYAVTSADYPQVARRPTHAILNGEKIKRDWGIELKDWRLSLQDVIELIAADEL